VRHAVAGVFAAVGLFFLFVLAVLVREAVADGATDGLLLIAVMLLVGGPLSIVYLLVANARGDLRDLLPYELRLKPRYVLAATPFGLAVLVAFGTFPPSALVVLVGFVTAWAAARARESAGEVSVEDGRLGVLSGSDERSYDVRKLRAHRSVAVGRTRVVRLRYAGSLSFSRPSLVLVPATDFPAVDRALSEIESRDYGLDARDTPRAAKAALVAFGLLFFGVAAFFVLAVDGREASLLISVVGILGALGAVFFAAAWAA
jgi:hypothetical protein